MNERILISGASIAGLTLAHWLARHGFRPTVVERAAALRTGGNGVDVVLNSLTGDFIPTGFSALRHGGYFVELGKIGIWTPQQAASARPDAGYAAIALDSVQQVRRKNVQYNTGFVLAPGKSHWERQQHVSAILA